VDIYIEFSIVFLHKNMQKMAGGKEKKEKNKTS
jgi:hypothetical protein